MSQAEYVKLNVTCYEATHEKRFPKGIPLGELAGKLELLCGISADAMQLSLYSDDQLIRELTPAEYGLSLSSLLPSSWEHLKLDVKDPTGQLKELLAGASAVPKFELSDEEYARRNDSVRSFKAQNKLGRFDDEASRHKEEEEAQKAKVEEEKASCIKVGDRCEVRVLGQPSRRGSVKFVGQTSFKPGTWVGVHLDEPLGKNDGSVAGVRYFDCPQKYGSFVKPTDVDVGDYPEEEIDFDEI